VSVYLEIKNEAFMLEIVNKGKGFSIEEKSINEYECGLLRLNSGIVVAQISLEIPLKNV
jgi:signal transduction histidine kinase